MFAIVLLGGFAFCKSQSYRSSDVILIPVLLDQLTGFTVDVTVNGMWQCRLLHS